MKQKSKPVVEVGKGVPQTSQAGAYALKIGDLGEALTVDEVIALVAPQLVAWAYQRAARASTDPTDYLGERITLLLLHKAIPASKRTEKGKDPQESLKSREELAKLDALYQSLGIVDSDYEERKTHHKRNTRKGTQASQEDEESA